MFFLLQTPNKTMRSTRVNSKFVQKRKKDETINFSIKFDNVVKYNTNKNAAYRLNLHQLGGEGNDVSQNMQLTLLN